MNMYEHVEVNRNGYLVTFIHPKDGKRTYACADCPSMEALVLRLTGRAITTFVLDSRGLPKHPSLLVAGGLHIYSSRL